MSGLGGGGLKTGGGGGGGSVTLSGDVVGPSSATVVEAIYGYPVSNTAPTTNQVLLFNGTDYVPTTLQAGGSLRATSGAPVIISSDLQYDYAIDETAGILYQLTGAGPYTPGNTWASYGQSTFSIMVNPMTTSGDVIYGGASGAATRLAAGTSGYALTTQGAGSAPIWAAVLANPMTTAGDMIVATTSGVPTRLPISGTNLYQLRVSSGTIGWGPSPSSVFTATGMLLYASSAGNQAGLAIGTTGQALIVASGLPAWGQPSLAATGAVIPSDVTMTATTAVTIFTTTSLAVGTWRMTISGVVTAPAATVATGLEIYTTAGTATYTVTGPASTELAYQLASADIPFGMDLILNVTVAGTINVVGYNNSASAATVRASTQGTSAKAGATGWSAFRVA